MVEQLDSITIFKTIAFSFLAFFLILVTVVVFIYSIRRKILANQLRSKDYELEMQKNAVQLMINAQEEERTRIARDLHDDISSKLNAVAMSLHVLKQNTLSPEDRADISSGSITTCKLIAESSRRIAHNLMPPTLENTGLHGAIQELCYGFSQSNQIKFNYINELEQSLFEKLSLEKQVHLYRIIQELINNSIKHAEAENINLMFEFIDDALWFTYTDDGIGFIKDRKNTQKGIGLNNISSRASILKAVPSYQANYPSGLKFTLIFNLL